ncbi:phosphate uptake regulator PhoU [archaeon]|nr:phosphate uptake regulator PhoU [archaeon]
MKKYTRKLQFVAGSTYSISLPKEWVKDFNLKPQQLLNLVEMETGLLISPENVSLSSNEISFSLDEMNSGINQILISSYYYGFEKINFYSKSEISPEAKRDIRNIISELPGAEIIYEDKKKLSIQIMFENLNVDIFQLLYRVYLLVESSIENIVSLFDWEEIDLNEKEVDRLYHLATKIITYSIKNRGVLISSKIENPLFLPSLFLISKRLENIEDNLSEIAKLVKTNQIVLNESKKILPELKNELERAILYLIGKRNKHFIKMENSMKERIKEDMNKIKNDLVKQNVRDILRYIVNIQEDVITLGFYEKLKN